MRIGEKTREERSGRELRSAEFDLVAKSIGQVQLNEKQWRSFAFVVNFPHGSIQERTQSFLEPALLIPQCNLCFASHYSNVRAHRHLTFFMILPRSLCRREMSQQSQLSANGISQWKCLSPASPRWMQKVTQSRNNRSVYGALCYFYTCRVQNAKQTRCVLSVRGKCQDKMAEKCERGRENGATNEHDIVRSMPQSPPYCLVRVNPFAKYEQNIPRQHTRTLHCSLLFVRQNPGILMPPIGIFFLGFCSSDSRSGAGAAPVCFVFSAFNIFSLSSSAISFLSILLF